MTTRREVKPASAGAKFRLLLWKNFLQQWRHPILTATEILLPIGTLALVLILRSQIEPVTKDTLNYPPIPAHTLNYSLLVLGGMNITRMSLAYSPTSPILDSVVRSAAVKLFAQNVKDLIHTILEQFPDINLPPDVSLNSTNIYEIVKSLVRVDAYNKSDDLRTIYHQENITRMVIAAVEFDDSLYGAEQLPSNISYALRFPERPRLNSFFSRGGRSWRTDSIFPMFELPGPRFPYSWEGGNDPGYINEMFIALQHAISSELISRITKQSLFKFGVQMQRYPHPAYVEDLAVELLQILFPMFILISFSITAVNIVRAVTIEKELQLKETMKIMGLPTWLHWTAWFSKQFFYLLFVSFFIVILLKVNWFTTEEGFNDYAVFTNTPWTVLFFFLLLYMACIIFFCFMISGFFSKASTAALFTGLVWYLTYIPAFLLAIDINMSTAVQTITCLSINSAMSYGFQLLLAKESTGGMQWGEFMSSPSPDSSRFLFGHVVLMLILDCVIYMIIALYLEQVLPGPYGTSKPWYFPFQRQFWCSNKKSSSDVVIIDTTNSQDIKMENDPTDLDIGVKMTNLTKIYGKNIVVNNLSLNIYDDQITVLLGHNGAGKSTTISMLTGNVKATCGSVNVAGYDMTQQTSAARSHIGLCPQHNVLFNELTVHEHLEFFSRLKGFTGEELHTEINTLIEKLELQEKVNYQAQGLSGGQKRRLSVGIALCGGARVVLLDEPTSGMDPASRRALWDLLQKEKRDRSMILTTHFMDEADILGDRVAIMANGRLQCVGSPYFLKQHYGVGYTLVVIKTEGFQYDTCTELIRKYIPNTTSKGDRGTEVTYSLTNNYSHMFEEMLKDLENNIGNIKFKNYGLVATTMEDVFMSVGADTVSANTESEDDVMTDSSSEEALRHEFDSSSLEQLNRKNESLTGICLWCQHMLAIWMKLWLVWTRSPGMVYLQVLVPVIQINTTLGLLKYAMSLVETIQSRALTLAEGYANTVTLLSYNGTNTTSLGALAKAAYELMYNTSNISTMELTVVDDQPIDQYYLEKTNDPVAMGLLRNRLLIGATFDEDSVTAWFSNFGYHDVATSLAAVHSALLKSSNPAAELNVFNHPLEVNYQDQNNLQMMVTMLSMNLASGIGNSLGIVSAVYIIFYIKERVSRARLLQKASGIQPIVMWGSAAVLDWAWFLVLCVPIIISCLIFNVIGLSTPAELARLYICLMVYGAAMLPINYVVSHIFNGPVVGFVFTYFANILLGTMGSQIVEALSSPQLDTKQAAEILDYILQFVPLYSLVSSIRNLNQIGLTKYSCLQACEYLSAVLPNLNECTMEAMCENYSETCCVRENAFFDWEEPGILRFLVCMIFTCIFFWSVLLIMEYNILRKMFTWEKKPPPVDESTLNADVVDEMKHVERVFTGDLREISLLTKGLSKYYGNHLAVDQVSFTVSDNECFGLLGVNGAGKTSTFKMLMGDETISSGDAYISGHSVKKNINKVYEKIGYCPQFDAVFEELTGRENLRLYSLLRGLRMTSSDPRPETLAQALGFRKHLDKRVNQYSGGNKRKLSTAIALLSVSSASSVSGAARAARLVFVDEPTTGVDAAARRRVWAAMDAARAAGCGLVLTSHSMEECEALCSRLTIMVNGRFQCLGTPQHLKNQFSEGFTLTIKMKANDEMMINTENSSIDPIKNYIESNFASPKLMEEYQGLITYYLPDRSMPWWKMFGIMERAKRELNIEDYTVSQTTLEQVFLQFTKYQQEGLLK